MNCIVISASSDIGSALCLDWLEKGHSVTGTFRTASKQTDILEGRGCRLFRCDLAATSTLEDLSQEIGRSCPSWDVLVLAGGLMAPIGTFSECSFDEWELSLRVNFTNQLRLLHGLLDFRNHQNPLGACVLFFAGGGTNGPAPCYSAYTLSKIASIKICELLDAEFPDLRFSTLGPGWVETKIHQQTVQAGHAKAGHNYERTCEVLKTGNFVSMNTVLNSCNWLVSQPKNVASGRNFSAAYDPLDEPSLISALENDNNMYKLRRSGNLWGKK